MSNLTKNPLRQLSSEIVNTCRAKGLKQSVVLDVLSKHQGYRSHQASDAATQNKATSISLAGISYLQGVLFNTYPDGDLLPITFSQVAGKLLDNADVGDAPFTEAWNALTQAPADFPAYIKTVLSAFVSLQGPDLFFDEAALRRAVMKTNLPFPLKEFCIREACERSEGLVSVEWSGSVYDSICRIIEDYEVVAEELCESKIRSVLL